MTERVRHIHYVARIGVALVFVYHGLVPKILWIAPLEQKIMEMNGLGDLAYLISPMAGVFEIALGLAVAFVRHSLVPVYIAAFMLVVFLINIAVTFPALLFDAFNPVSTNLMCLLLCYVIFLTQPAK